jgi:uncharacterized protein
MDITRRNTTIPKGSFFLFGPRGTGKTTWLRQQFGHALWLDLLDPENQRLYLARPERLREWIDAHPDAHDVVIDEIQKVPALLDVVHQLVEGDRSIRFILTGSSARKLRRHAVNLLAGRLLRVEMHPFTANELGKAFDLTRALSTGMIPLIWNADDPKQTLRAYAALYLREEVQAEAMVRDIGAFSRFLESISFSHGSQINLSAIARECQVGRKAVEGYLDILEDLMLSFRVPVFTRRAKRHLVAQEKFYFFDTGVYRSLRPAGPLDRPEEIGGVAFEGLIAQHLRANIANNQTDEQLYYWRTKSGSEVDFVVYGSSTFAAYEVKHHTKVHTTDLRSLKAFRDDYPEATVSLIYLGSDRLQIDGISIVPAVEMLTSSIGHRALGIEH